MIFDGKNISTIDLESYLSSKGVEIVSQSGEELIVKCPFSDCDADSKGKEGHCSFNKETGTYHCFKCEAKGNKVTLAKFFGDWKESDKSTLKPKPKKQINPSNLDKIAEKCHKNLSKKAKEYLHNRGLSDDTIEQANIGQGEFYGQTWLTIPVKHGGCVVSLKLRAFPEERSPKYMKWPKEKSEAQLYGGAELFASKAETACITEGEFDSLIARQNNLPFTVSGTAGAGTFKEEWLEYFRYVKTIYLALDNDEKGDEGADKLFNLIQENRPDITIFYIQYPEKIKDMTEYFVNGLSSEELIENATYIAGPPKFDISEMNEMTLEDLELTLDQTIKFEKANKCILFLACLTAYTEEDQLNVYIIGPSSSGKTYLMKEIAEFFPSEDKEILADVSAKALKHRKPVTDPVTGEQYVDLERKLLFFQDMPEFHTLETLRPLMSHDSKMTEYQTTDKGKNTEHIVKISRIKGFPVIVVCSANTNLDEQESTRAFVLSPEVSVEKIEAGVIMANRRAANPEKYKEELDNNPERQKLIERIRYIKSLHVNSVIIPFPEETLAKFKEISKINQPRSQREISHFNSLIKAVTMLNAPFRLDENDNLIATKADLEMASELWEKTSKPTDLGVNPYLWDFYKSYILSASLKNSGKSPTRLDIIKAYEEKTGNKLSLDKLRKTILPRLEKAKLLKTLEIPGKKERLIKPLVNERGKPIDDSGKNAGMGMYAEQNLVNGENE